MEKIKLLDSAGNYCVAHYLERHYPGVLIQGDSLRRLYDDLAEAVEEVAKDPKEGIESIAIIQEELIEHLDYYEEVLNKHEIQLPYGTSIKGTEEEKQ